MFTMQNLLTDIVSKVMADVPSTRNAKLSSQLPEDETESPSFDLFAGIFPEPPAKRFVLHGQLRRKQRFIKAQTPYFGFISEHISHSLQPNPSIHCGT